MADFIRQLLNSMGVNVDANALVSITAILASILGYYIARLLSKRTIDNLKDRHLAAQNAGQSLFDDQIDQLSHTFNSLSQEALRNNNESFLSLAEQRFVRLQSAASNELKSTEQSFSDLLTPIKESLAKTDVQLKKIDLNRKVSETKIGEQINNLLRSQSELQSETRNLVTALRRPEVRGQWGELTLKRLVELAGMSPYCDFDEQITVKTDSGVLRPDMLVRLPSERILVVDVKTPLDAYISATEAQDPEHQKTFLIQHSKNVKNRIKELSLKQYWRQFERSPDFVILFIPGDQFLSAALDQDKSLLEFALQQKILLATPTSLVGLLRAVAYGWNQESLSKNSDEIRRIGETLFNRIETLTTHLNKLGHNLDQSVEQFNRVAGSYENNTLPAARKLSELGIGNDAPKELEVNNGVPTRRV